MRGLLIENLSHVYAKYYSLMEHKI